MIVQFLLLHIIKVTEMKLYLIVKLTIVAGAVMFKCIFQAYTIIDLSFLYQVNLLNKGCL